MVCWEGEGCGELCPGQRNTDLLPRRAAPCQESLSAGFASCIGASLLKQFAPGSTSAGDRARLKLGSLTPEPAFEFQKREWFRRRWQWCKGEAQGLHRYPLRETDTRVFPEDLWGVSGILGTSDKGLEENNFHPVPGSCEGQALQVRCWRTTRVWPILVSFCLKFKSWTRIQAPPYPDPCFIIALASAQPSTCHTSGSL